MKTVARDQLHAQQRYRRASCFCRLVFLVGHLFLADAFKGFSSCPPSAPLNFTQGAYCFVVDCRMLKMSLFYCRRVGMDDI